MKEVEIKQLINDFKNSEAEWKSDLWSLCEFKYREIQKVINEKNTILKEENEKDILNIVLFIYELISIFEFGENPYLEIIPPTKKVKFYKNNKVKRRASLNKDAVNSLIDKVFSTTYFLLGSTLLEMYKKKHHKFEEHFKRFNMGREVNEDDQKLYNEIILIQKELFKKYHSGHKASLTQAVRIYNKRCAKGWTDKNGDIKRMGQNVSNYMKSLNKNPK